MEQEVRRPEAALANERKAAIDMLVRCTFLKVAHFYLEDTLRYLPRARDTSALGLSTHIPVPTSVSVLDPPY